MQMQLGVSPGGVWRRMGFESCSPTNTAKAVAATGEHWETRNAALESLGAPSLPDQRCPALAPRASPMYCCHTPIAPASVGLQEGAGSVPCSPWSSAGLSGPGLHCRGRLRLLLLLPPLAARGNPQAPGAARAPTWFPSRGAKLQKQPPVGTDRSAGQTDAGRGWCWLRVRGRACSVCSWAAGCLLGRGLFPRHWGSYF